MTTYTGLTFGGTPWIPLFVQTLNQTACIGCGRCYKVCPRDVLTLVDRTEALGDDFEEDEDSDMDNTVVMAISNLADCIGCEACSKVCPKKCFAHASMAA